MLQLTSCGTITVDQREAIVNVNARMLEWLKCARAEVVGRQLETFLTLRMPLAGTEGMLPTDATLHGMAGVVRPVVVGALLEPGGTQQIVVFDVSARSAFSHGFRDAEAKTERGRQRLQILLNSAAGFGDVRSETDAAELLVDAAQQAFAASHVSVHLQQPSGVRQVAGVNPLAPHWPQGQRPTGAVTLLGGEVLIVRTPDDADVHADGMSDVFRASGIEATISSPLRSQGQAVGSLVCYFDHPREFDEEAIPLAEALSQQAAQAVSRIRLEETMRRAAMHDEVTGLRNRRLVEEDVSRTLLEDYTALTVLFIDLDGFKAVNDLLGHAAGDALLREVGRRVCAATRESDILGRFGGDEFIVVAATDGAHQAVALADRVRKAIAVPYDDLPPDLAVTASIGVVTVDDGRAPVMDQLIRAADHAMYEAKLIGGNCVAVTEPPVVATV